MSNVDIDLIIDGAYHDCNGNAEVCGNLINALNSIYTGYESSMRRNTHDI